MKKEIGLIIIVLVLTGILFGETIKYQGFESGLDDWTYTPNPATAPGSPTVWEVSSGLGGLAMSTNYWGVSDLSKKGTTDFGTLTFANVNISDYFDVTISFDWEVDAFDIEDTVKYEVYFNDIGQGEVILVATDTTASGSDSISVSSTTDSVYVILSVKQDGKFDYASFDNFKVTGTHVIDLNTKIYLEGAYK